MTLNDDGVDRTQAMSQTSMPKPQYFEEKYQVRNQNYGQRKHLTVENLHSFHPNMQNEQG